MQKNYFLIISALATTVCHTSYKKDGNWKMPIATRSQNANTIQKFTTSCQQLKDSCQQLKETNVAAAKKSLELSRRYAELAEASSDLLFKFYNPESDINAFLELMPERLRPLMRARWQELQYPSNPSIRSLILQNTKKAPDYNGYILAQNIPKLTKQLAILQAKNKELEEGNKRILINANTLLYKTFNQALILNTLCNHPLTHAQVADLIDNPWLKDSVLKAWNVRLAGNLQTPFCQSFLNIDNIPTSSGSDSPEIEKPASPEDLDNLCDLNFFNQDSLDDGSY